MPDWTYVPLRRPMAVLLGRQRSLEVALSVLAAIARFPGGPRLIRLVGRTAPPAQAATVIDDRVVPAPVGASVSINHAGKALAAIVPLGAGMIEVRGVRCS